MIGCDKKEFIFGDYKEREENVKLFLLALIMNSDKNKENKHVTPFINGLFKYKDKKDFVNDNEIGEISGNLDKVSKEIIEIKNKLKRLYPFFANERVSEKYQNILHKQSSEIELFSNLLIKLMFGDYGFKNFYILKVQEICERNKSNEIAYSFLLNKGTIAARLIEGKNGIYVFANAFERMWERHKGYFVEFFNKYLFNEVEKDDFKFRKINNTLFNYIITSEKMSSMLFSLLEKDRFSIETLDGHFLFYQHMINKFVDKEIEDSL